MNLEWLVVGGGIHGVHMAVRLLADRGINPDGLRIVDPEETLLNRWKACTEATGMTHLRSPAVHHLDLDPFSLKKFAGKKKNKKLGAFSPPFDRPALRLFNAHCDDVIRTYGLEKCHVKARAMESKIDCDGVSVSLSTGDTIVAQNVVLAIGAGDAPEWPTWAPRGHARISHVFSTDFEPPSLEAEAVAVVGGGISAAQVSLRFMREGHTVHLISRHVPRKHQFDSEPGWLGPKLMRGFSAEKDLDVRRATITDARHRGSLPPDVWRAFHRAMDQKQMHWHQTEVDTLEDASTQLNLHLKSEASLNVQRVVLATGFSTQRPGGRFVDSLIESMQLPCAQCGYPMVTEGLRWHPRVYVAGPLAELELGPTARNIAGARRAGDRIMNELAAQAELSRKAS